MMTELQTTTKSRASAPALSGGSSAPVSIQYSGRQIAQNSIYNHIGLLAPMVVAFISIPVLVAYLGTERFGLLSLAWMVVGYFNIFDMGISRATTKFVAESVARQDSEEVSRLVWNAFYLSVLSGALGAITAASLTPLVATRFLNIPPQLIGEAQATFFLLSLAIPIQLLSASARGVLEAQQKFALVNAIRIPGSISSFVVPLLILPFSTNLFVIILGLSIAKLVVLVIQVWQALKSLNYPAMLRPEKRYLFRLLGYGKWVTVSSMLSPLMGQLDRFLIGAVLTISAVAYYSTPFDLMTKLFIIPTGLVTVLFPVFSAYSGNHREKLAALRDKAVRYIICAMLPITLGVVMLSRPFLSLWLNEEFARQGTLVMQILAIGVLANSIGRVALAAIEAAGRPDLTAKLYLIEAPLYIWLLWYCTLQLGLAGAAAVWTIRLITETVILVQIMHRLTPDSPNTGLRWPIYLTGMTCLLLIAGGICMIQTLAVHLTAAIALLIAVALAIWHYCLDTKEHSELLSLLNLKQGRGRR